MDPEQELELESEAVHEPRRGFSLVGWFMYLSAAALMGVALATAWRASENSAAPGFLQQFQSIQKDVSAANENARLQNEIADMVALQKKLLARVEALQAELGATQREVAAIRRELENRTQGRLWFSDPSALVLPKASGRSLPKRSPAP